MHVAPLCVGIEEFDWKSICDMLKLYCDEDINKMNLPCADVHCFFRAVLCLALYVEPPRGCRCTPTQADWELEWERRCAAVGVRYIPPGGPGARYGDAGYAAEFGPCPRAAAAARQRRITCMYYRVDRARRRQFFTNPQNFPFHYDVQPTYSPPPAYSPTPPPPDFFTAVMSQYYSTPFD